MGLINLKTTTEVQAKAIDLNQMILSAQNELFAVNATQAALVEEVRDLKEQITRMKDWEAQKQRYKLVTPFYGCLVYALQESMSSGETPHYICTSCYENGKRSILQNAQNKEGWTALQCPVCRMQAPTGFRGNAEFRYAEDAASPA